MKRLVLKPENLFSPIHETGSIARKSVVGGMTTLSSQVVLFVVRTATTVVLARLLTPADFGLIGMVAVIINFATMFKSAGLSMATVQKEEITREQISTLFWINVIISLSLGLLVLAVSPLVAFFYGKPELTGVTAALSASFIITGLTVQHQALLKRHMRFGALAVITISAQVFHLLVAVVLARLGFGYWALVGGGIASAIVNTFLTFVFCPWIPSRMKRGTGVRNMLWFGGHLTGFNFINYFSRNTDYILIGKFLGANALGLYTKAYHMFLLPISQIRTPINNVAIPALCAIRNNYTKYKKYYRVIIFLTASLSMPIVGIMVVYAENVIRIMLGNQWQDAVGVFRVLALVGFVQAAAQAGRGLPLMSLGFSKRYLHFGIVQAITTIIGIIVGLNWGIKGVAAGYAIAFVLVIPFTLPWCLKGSPLKVSDWLHAMLSPTVATSVMVPSMFLVKSIMSNDVNPFEVSLLSNLKVLAIGGIMGLMVFIIVLLMIPSGREYLKSVKEQFLRMRRSREVKSLD